ncbi:MAG: hypothetical protein ACTHLX_21915 [Candidatus Binatia bacterium]
MGYSDLVAIVLERLGTFQGNFTGRLALASLIALPRKNSLAFPARQGIGATLPTTRALRRALNDGRDGNDGVITGEPLPYFVVETLATGLGAGTWR